MSKISSKRCLFWTCLFFSPSLLLLGNNEKVYDIFMLQTIIVILRIHTLSATDFVEILINQNPATIGLSYSGMLYLDNFFLSNALLKIK